MLTSLVAFSFLISSLNGSKPLPLSIDGGDSRESLIAKPGDDSSLCSRILGFCSSGSSEPKIEFPVEFGAQFIGALLRTFQAGRNVPLLELERLANEVTRLYSSVPNVVEVNFPPSCVGCRFAMVGDTHGQLADLLKVIDEFGEPSASRHMMLNGDFVDRGDESVEVLALVYALKAAYPDFVHLNRGNHESKYANAKYGFTAEFISKYYSRVCFLTVGGREAVRVKESINRSFDALPLGHIFNKRVLVVHAGISQLSSVEDMNSETRVGAEARPWSKLYQVMWSDPTDVVLRVQEGNTKQYKDSTKQYTDYPYHYDDGHAASKRGQTVRLFTFRHTERFIRNSNRIRGKGYEICKIMRSHETIDLVNLRHRAKVLTVFTASNYMGDEGNWGGYLEIPVSEEATAVSMKESVVSKEETSVLEQVHVSEQAFLESLNSLSGVATSSAATPTTNDVAPMFNEPTATKRESHNPLIPEESKLNLDSSSPEPEKPPVPVSEQSSVPVSEQSSVSRPRPVKIEEYIDIVSVVTWEKFQELFQSDPDNFDLPVPVDHFGASGNSSLQGASPGDLNFKSVDQSEGPSSNSGAEFLSTATLPAASIRHQPAVPTICDHSKYHVIPWQTPEIQIGDLVDKIATNQWLGRSELGIRV